MDLPENPFKRALAEGRPQIGLWCTLSSHVVIEVLAGSGFDWLLLDTEHSPNELPMVLSQLQAAAGYPTHAVVRPAWNDMVTIKRLLDVGAQSLIIPYVQNAEEARRAVAYTRYPPDGKRGVSGVSRATRFGRIADYGRRAHQELCVAVQVETREALTHIEEMAAVSGVDGIFVGPADLAADMGRVGEQGHPEVQAAIEDAITRIRRAGKAPGILYADEARVRRYLELGALFVAVGVDAAILARETQALAVRYKRPAAPTGG
jgi:4-hydroxy-2-oxoheptanedioate aldolase